MFLKPVLIFLLLSAPAEWQATLSGPLVPAAAAGIPHVVAEAVQPIQEKEPDQYRFLLLRQDFISDVQQATQLLYNQQFDEASSLLSAWFASEQARPLALLWDALPLWWQILSDLEAQQHDDAFVGKMEQAIRASDLMLRRDRHNLDALVVKTLANGFLARLHANRGSWYRSLVHGRQAINLLNGIEQLYPELPDIQFGLGLYSYFTAYFHEQYRLVRVVSWMVPAGDMQEGLSRLKTAADESAFMIPEAVYFLAHIYLHYEQQPEVAELYLNRLLEEYPHNLFFNRLLLRSYYRQGRLYEALQFSEQILERADPSTAPATLEEVYTMRGFIYYRRGRLDLAESCFLKTLALAPQLEKGDTRAQQLRARYQLGRLYERLGRRDEAQQQFRHIVSLRTDSPVKKQARRHLD
ncbi:MAG: tetratricopeptide repeat protein [Balneolales bacterium]|nr:tetratricopeptide repeat protein [Balneolales bacterium]